MPSRGLVFAALLVAALPVAAAATSIADIVDHPDTYAGTQVTVVGTVTQQPLGYLGESLYTITADNRRITVVSGQPTVSGVNTALGGGSTNTTANADYGVQLNVSSPATLAPLPLTIKVFFRPISLASAPPIRPPSGIVPQTMKRMTEFIRPWMRSGVIA